MKNFNEPNVNAKLSEQGGYDMSCYKCGGEKENARITLEQDGRTYVNFPVRQCKECGERTYGAGSLIYYPTYAKHLNVSTFDCDSIEWRELCNWIRDYKKMNSKTD